MAKGPADELHERMAIGIGGGVVRLIQDLIPRSLEALDGRSKAVRIPLALVFRRRTGEAAQAGEFEISVEADPPALPEPPRARVRVHVRKGEGDELNVYTGKVER